MCFGVFSMKHARTCMTPFHPTACWLFLPPSFQSDGGMLGMEDVDKNHVGMAQNVESDTSIPHDIQSF